MKGISTISRTNVTNIFYLHKAELRNLRPGARYSYCVSIDGSCTPIRSLSTFNPRGANSEVCGLRRFAEFAGRACCSGRALHRHSPDFILHTGDLVARGKDYALWSREFFRPASGV